MSLVNCPECQHQVSDKAKSCPNCGYPLGESSQEEKIDISFMKRAAIYDKAIQMQNNKTNANINVISMYEYIIDNWPNSEEANLSKIRLKELVIKADSEVISAPQNLIENNDIQVGADNKKQDLTNAITQCNTIKDNIDNPIKYSVIMGSIVGLLSGFVMIPLVLSSVPIQFLIMLLVVVIASVKMHVSHKTKKYLYAFISCICFVVATVIGLFMSWFVLVYNA